MIELSHLSHSFGRNWALKNVSFNVEKGEFLFLTGPSGAGKTTLMRILHGSLPVQAGRARVADFDLKTLKPRHLHLLRRQVSVVFQDFKIMPDRTVWENVALPLVVQGMPRSQIAKRVRAVLRSLHLDNMSMCNCEELSGGEQQRVAIGRAIVVNPKLILADEPTGNLDSGLSWRLLQIFRKFHTYGTTIVLATHSEELLRVQPEAKVLSLESGRVVGTNWTAEVD
ncbi:MAG: cell division ATP-binding protein FtsE [Desulfonatronovibrionaceae bacterium]